MKLCNYFCLVLIIGTGSIIPAEADSKTLPGELSLDYSSYIGGSAGEDGTNLVLDSHDHAYISCNTSSIDWPTTAGAFSRTFAGGSGSESFGGDTAALKLNATGSGIDWGTYIGGSQDEFHSYYSVVDSAGNLYVTGVTRSANFPSTWVAGTRGGDDIFVVKFDAAGRRVWALVVAGSGNEVPHGIALDNEEFPYILGRTNSTNFPTHNSIGGSGQWELFILCLSRGGQYIHWNTLIGPGDTSGIGSGAITIDDQDNVYVATHCSRDSFTTTMGDFQGGTQDVYVAKFTKFGQRLLWATYLGGNQDEQADGIKVAPDGSVIITGSTTSPDFPTTSGAYDRTHHGGHDMFLTRLSATGQTIEFSTLLGTSGDDSGGFVGWLNDNLVVLVNAGERELPATQDMPDHNGKMFLGILDPEARDLLFGAYVGGTDCYGFTQILDSNGHIWICGSTLGQDLPTTEGAFQRSYQGGYRDGFVMRLSFGTIQNQTTGQRYASIQYAINDAHPGDTLILPPGFYQECLILNKDLVIQSLDPNDPYYIGGTIIQGDPNCAVLTMDNRSEACEIAGMTLRAGMIGLSGTGTDAIIRNCRIMDNETHGIELFDGSDPILQNCLIAANGQTGITMHERTGGRSTIYCQPTIEDCVIVQNGETDVVGGKPVVIDSIFEE